MRPKGFSYWIGLAAILLVGGCSAGAALRSEAPEQVGTTAAAGLPGIGALDGMSATDGAIAGKGISGSGGQTITWPIEPTPLAQSANVTPLVQGYQLSAGPGEMAWLIVRCEDYGMVINWLKIRLHLVSGEAYCGIADFTDDRWEFYKHDPAKEDLSELPELPVGDPKYISPNGYNYYAIVVHDGSVAETIGHSVRVTAGEPVSADIMELETYAGTRLVEYESYPAIIFNDEADKSLKIAYTHNEFPYHSDNWEITTISTLPASLRYFDAIVKDGKLFVVYTASNYEELHVAWTAGALSQDSEWHDVLSRSGNVALGETLQQPRLAASASRLYMAYTNWDPQDLNEDTFSYQICYSELDDTLLAQPYVVTQGTSLSSPEASLAVIANKPALASGDAATGLRYLYASSPGPQNAADWTTVPVSAEPMWARGVFLCERQGKPILFAQKNDAVLYAAYALNAAPDEADWISQPQTQAFEPGSLRATMCGNFAFWMGLHDFGGGQFQMYERRGMSYDFDPNKNYPYSRQLQDMTVGTYSGHDCISIDDQPCVSWIQRVDGAPAQLQYVMQTY